MIHVSKFNELSNLNLYQICQLREEIFILEQLITSEMELDSNDQNAIHYYIKKDNQVVSYARVIVTDDYVKLGRICTKKSYRKQGLAALIIKYVLNSYDNVMLSAQYHLVNYYKQFGFLPVGNKYKEANIFHQKMIYIK